MISCVAYAFKAGFTKLVDVGRSAWTHDGPCHFPVPII